MFLYNESVKECNHEKIVIIAVLAILFVVISACGNKEKRHNINLLSNLKMLSKTKKNYNMDNIHLKEIDHLSKTDTTDKNSKEFKALQEDVKNHLIPKFEAYYKSAKNLPDDTMKVKKIKKNI